MARLDHRGRDPRGLRIAAAAAAAHRAADPRVASRPRAAAAALLGRLWPCDRRGRDPAALDHPRRAARRLCRRRPRRDVPRTCDSRMVAGPCTDAAAARRRHCLAVRTGQYRASWPGQRGADRGVRPGFHGAVAARTGPQRPAQGLAGESSNQRAQLLHDQHPAGRGRGGAGIFCQVRLARNGAGAARACPPDQHQRQAARPDYVHFRSRQWLRRARSQPDLVAKTDRGQQDHRRQVVGRVGAGQCTPRLGRKGLCRDAGSQARRPGDLRRGWRAGDGARDEPARSTLGYLQAQFLHGVFAGSARERDRYADHERARRAVATARTRRARAPVPRNNDHRPRCAAVTGARRHGQGFARSAVRIPLHACRGPDGAACRRAVHARRTALRKRNVAHARRQPRRRIPGRGLGIPGSRRTVRFAGGSRRHRRGVRAGDARLRPEIHARSVGLGDRRPRRRVDGWHRGPPRGAQRRHAAAAQSIVAVVAAHASTVLRSASAPASDGLGDRHAPWTARASLQGRIHGVSPMPIGCRSGRATAAVARALRLPDQQPHPADVDALTLPRVALQADAVFARPERRAVQRQSQVPVRIRRHTLHRQYAAMVDLVDDHGEARVIRISDREKKIQHLRRLRRVQRGIRRGGPAARIRCDAQVALVARSP